MLAALALLLVPPQIPQTPPSPRWQKLLEGQVRYLLANIAPAPIPHELEHAIRPRASTALAAAVCARFAGCREAAPAAVAYLTELTRTHLTGAAPTGNGKPWGHHWQSALWAWQAAFAAWLLWPDLPPALQSGIERMVVDEADRFLDLPPPYARFLDTKAEENAWNSLILIFAAETLPRHAHSPRWRSRGLEYMISAFATRADRSSARVVDGRPLARWLGGANALADYTLENHGFVHPDYMSTISLNLTNALVYRLLGKPIPAACTFNVRPVYANLKRFTLHDGGLLYPNSTDWALHRLEITASLHEKMDRLAGDRHARALADAGLATLEKMQARSNAGRLFAPGEFSSYDGHEAMAGWTTASALLFSRLWPATPRPKPAAEVWKELEGAVILEDARLLVQRTPVSVSSFSWGLRVMGLTLPFTADPMLAPLNLSYVGLTSAFFPGGAKPSRIGIASDRLAAALAVDPITIRTAIAGQENGAVHVTANAARGRSGQVFSFTALAGGSSVYMERWTRSEQQLGGLLFLAEEDHWVHAQGRRRVEHDGRTWASVDNRLGLVVAGGGGIRVIPELACTLVALNAPPRGDAIIVTLPGATGDETRAAAASLTRLTASHPDLCAARVGRFTVVTNFSPHPMRATVAGRELSINGFSTRVLGAEP